MFKGMTATNQRNMVILFGSLVVVMLGFGIIIPILPFYVESMGANGFDLGLLMSIFAFTQLIFSPLWGNLSDRIGRRPVLLIGILGNVVTQVLFGLSTELWQLYGARALSGILSSATFPAAMAYISDCTSDEERGGGMGVLGAAMGIGMVLGPGLGGTLAKVSLSLPFYVAAGLSLLILIIAYFMMPESLPAELCIKDIRGLKGLDFRRMWLVLRGPLGYLMFLSFLVSFGLTNFESVFGLYALKRFDYDTTQVGLILMAVGITSAIGQGVLTGPSTKRWGEYRVIQVSLIASAVGFLLMLLARSFAMVLATTTLFILGNAMLRPAVSSLLSKRTDQGQGVTMGLSNSFMSVGRVLGPMWAGFVLDVNLSLPYLSGAIIMALSFATTLLGMAQRPRPRHVPVPASEC